MMRRRTRKEGGNGSYWPGYVDALTNVVLNLLFLIAIFSAGVFSMGMQMSSKGMAQMREVLGMTPPTPSVTPVTPVARIVVAGEGPSVADHDKRVALQRVRQVAGEPLATIGFEAAAVTVPPADRAALEAALRPLLRDGVSAVQVWTVVDAADAVSRRAGYLRVMAIRDFLHTLSVDATRIDTRLVSGHVQQGAGQMVYVLVRSRAEIALQGMEGERNDDK